MIADDVTHIVLTIVRHMERGNREMAHLNRLTISHYTLTANWDFGPDAIVVIQTMVNTFGGIDGNIKFLADTASRLDVVGVVMGYNNILYIAKPETVVVKMLLECAQTYADINHQTIILIIKIVAITAAPATERYKIKH